MPQRPRLSSQLLFHDKATAENTQWRGIHPLHTLETHELSLPRLVRAALDCRDVAGRIPDLIAVTQGPGMLSSVRTGLNVAKGLALAWNVPFIGVHHMQAHALTPRLEEALQISDQQKQHRSPSFPFLSVLVSGGHTLMLRSESLFVHQELATVNDIAIGVCLDRVARNILPDAVLDSISDSGYARLLETYAFPDGIASYDYKAPRRRQDELRERLTPWGWGIVPPLIDTREMKFSFSGIDSSVKRIVGQRKDSMDEAERRCLAQKAMEAAFESLGSRVIMALDAQKSVRMPPLATVVLSGGVASNQFLRLVLRQFLDARGYPNVKLSYPRPSLCTDNAAMIAWAGMEMFEAGWRSHLACVPISKWKMSPDNAGHGGLLESGAWYQQK
jgi:N6-L-threonylcarbamoyladenine synthase